MNILLTGGAGFMGSNMIHYLFEHYPDYRILNFDKLTYAGNLENLRDIEHDERYEFVHGDIVDDVLVQRVVQKFRPDAILNYAAETHVDRSIMHPRAFLDTEILGTYALCAATTQWKIPKFIQISTDEVFGSITEGVFHEESPFAPNSPYAAAKAGADLLCRSYWQTYQTPIIVTHSCNFFGPYQFPEKIIPLFITNALEGKDLPLYGDGSHVREWIYTEDHCRAIDRILHDGIPGEVYNIGTGMEMSNRTLSEKICDSIGISHDHIQRVTDRPGHDWRYAIDHTKITRELGWRSEIVFDEALARTVAWYKDHRQWWEPLKTGIHAEYFHKQYESRDTT